MLRLRLKRVISYPRLHACLFDLGNATPRKHGGAGFSIAGLPAIVDARPSSRMDVVYSVEVDGSTRTAISAAIRRLARVRPSIAAQLRIVSVPPQHVGLGSKTAVILAVLKAIDLVCTLRLTKSDLQFLSGRGGTSGVGINVFFTGGFVVDGGHDSRVHRGFLPSRFRRPLKIPPSTCRIGIPAGWRFHLLLAPGKLMHGIEERRFFERNTPIPRGEVFQTIALAFHGLVPAVRTGDLRLLRDILDSIHEIGFKHRELSGQSAVVRSIVRSLYRRGDCAVGLSSMGPLVYAVSNADNGELSEFVESLSRSTGARMLGAFSGRNLGYRKQ
jgi:beta-ribofuranosylaminobenzene 5'-phosphate synthase